MVTTIEQNTLFGEPRQAKTAASSTIPRKAERERAKDNADPNFLARYERFLIIIGPVLNRFVAADVTEAFEKQYGKISETNAKALGSLYGDLQRRRVIVKTGEWRPRKNGNASLEYEFGGER